jgi:vacuolar-type H+-ATPase subunit H
MAFMFGGAVAEDIGGCSDPLSGNYRGRGWAWRERLVLAVSERSSGAFAARQGPLGPISGFLERFRRSGGVPAAVGGDAASELAGVFAALDRLELEAEALRESSRAAVTQHEREIEQQAHRIVAEARAQAESARDDAVEAGLRAAETEAAAVVAQAEADATRIREAGQERLPDFVAGVLARVLEAGS